jgi:hypothetical protein
MNLEIMCTVKMEHTFPPFIPDNRYCTYYTHKLRSHACVLKGNIQTDLIKFRIREYTLNVGGKHYCGPLSSLSVSSPSLCINLFVPFFPSFLYYPFFIPSFWRP